MSAGFFSQTQSYPLGDAFGPIIGSPAWLVRRGHGSFLTLEFGEPHLKIREPKVAPPEITNEQARTALQRRLVIPRGDWHLWIYCCHWRVLSTNTEVAWSESPDAEIDKAARILDGRHLVSVEVDPSKGTSVFKFEQGAHLQTWPYGKGADEQWMLCMKSGDVFRYREDGFYSLGPRSTSPDEVVWLPLQPDSTA